MAIHIPDNNTARLVIAAIFNEQVSPDQREDIIRVYGRQHGDQLCARLAFNALEAQAKIVKRAHAAMPTTARAEKLEEHRLNIDQLKAACLKLGINLAANAP